MITRNQAMDLLLDACPFFRPTWESHLAERESEDEELLYYPILADLARHLAGMLERGKTSSFPQIFAVIERLHLEGDDWVKEAAVVGLLEDMQNGNLHNTTRPEQFRPYLLPESEKWWDRLYGFWERGEPLNE